MRNYIHIRQLILLALLFLATSPSYAVGDKLQEYINSISRRATRAGNDTVDVDLSRFDSVRTTTLRVNQGIKMRFINGKLKRGANFTEGPVIDISPSANASTTLVIGKEAVIDGAFLNEYYPVIQMNGNCECIISGGVVRGNTSVKASAKSGKGKQDLSFGYPGVDIAMEGNGGTFTIRNGYVQNYFTGTSGAKAVNLLGGSIGYVSLYSETTLGGNFQTDNQIYLGSAAILRVVSKLNHQLFFEGLSVKNDLGRTVFTGKDYQLTTSDANMVQHLLGPDYVFKLVGNTIILAEKETEITTASGLQEALDAIAAKGTSTLSVPDTIRISSKGCTIDKTIYVRNGCHAVLTGGYLLSNNNISASRTLFDISANSSLNLQGIDLLGINTERYNVKSYFYINGQPNTGENGILTIGDGVRFAVEATTTRTTGKVTVSGDWASVTQRKPFMVNISKKMYDRVNFADIPEELETHYDTNAKTAFLWKKEMKSDPLQHYLDSLAKASQDAKSDSMKIEPPSFIILDKDTVDVGNGTDPFQAYLDGLKEDSTNKQMNFDGGYLNVTKNTTLTISNYDFHATRTGYIHVWGTLIIDVNIHIYNVYSYIRVRRGGKVIWRDARGKGTDITRYFIYVDDGGTIEYRGGDASGGKRGFESKGIYYHYRGRISGTEWSGYTYRYSRTYIFGGEIIGKYRNEGSTTLSGGKITGEYFNYDTTIVRRGWIDGYIHNYHYFYIENGGDSIGEINNYVGGEYGGRIYITRKLNVVVRVHVNVTNIFYDTPVITGYDGYELTDEDLKHLNVDVPEGYEIYIYRHIVYIRPKVYYSDPLQEHINFLLNYFKGTESDPAEIDLPSGGIILDNTSREVVIGSETTNVYVYINGLRTDNTYKTFVLNGGSIRVYKGSTLVLRNLDLGGASGYIYVSGTLIIDVNVNIQNVTRLIRVLDGGRVIWRNAKGSGGIDNYGNLYIYNGGEGLGSISIFKTGRIYITTKLVTTVNINISESDLSLDTPIILGFGGYTLSEEDLKLIQITLPDGYSWRYDSTLGGIIIYIANGINSVTLDNATDNEYYDLNGNRLPAPRKGINIIRKNGKTRKVIVR